MQVLPRNPYIAGKALGDVRGFFGRESVFHLVENTLSSLDRNSVVLFGQRRIGKTSILLNLQARLPSPPFKPVYFDLMDRARKSLGEVLYELAATIAQELQLPQPERQNFKDDGRAFRRTFLPTVYAELGSDNRLILLFDEFDVLDVQQQEQLASNTAARAFFPFLRELMTSEPRLGFVFVVGRKAEELGIEFKSAFKASRYCRVSVLGEESAKVLVLTAQSEGLLQFNDDAVQRVLALTGRHPYFTQLMCQVLFERAYQGYEAGKPVPVVTVADVDAIITKVLEAGENIFEWIWEGLPPAERVIFAAIAAGTEGYTVVSEEQLLNVLQGQGIRILIRELELAPKTLVEWEMLKTANGGYQFNVELVRRWVVERKPLVKVKDDLDRIVPLADTLYQAGNGFFRQENYDEAISQLQNAIRVNPNHYKARRLLGDIYRIQGQYGDAVRELEAAYTLDEAGTQVQLELVLLQEAESFERNNQIDQALQNYTRVLTISPHSKLAKERYTSIWKSRAEQALEMQDLLGARAAFQKAEATKRVTEVEQLIRTSEIERLKQLAEDANQQEKWENAIDSYKQLIELDESDQRWQAGLEKAESEQKLEQRYAAGLVAIQSNEWETAQAAFSDVVSLRPNYKDVPKYLAQVNRILSAVMARSDLRRWVLSGMSGWALGLAIIGGLYAATGISSGYRETSTLGEGVTTVVSIVVAVAASSYWQWRILRQHIPFSERWLVISILGAILGVTIGWLVGNITDSIWALWIIAGLVSGLLLGTAQWLALREHISNAWWWLPFSMSSWIGSGALYAGLVIIFGSLLGELDLSRFFTLDLQVPPKIYYSIWVTIARNILSGGVTGAILGIFPAMISGVALIWVLQKRSGFNKSITPTNSQFLASKKIRWIIPAAIAVSVLSLAMLMRYVLTIPTGLRTITGVSPHGVRSLDFSPDGSLLASGGSEETRSLSLTPLTRVCLWGTNDGSLVRELWISDVSTIFSVSFSKDGNFLATAGEDGSIRIYNVSDGSLTHTWSSDAYEIAFSPMGDLLASGHRDGSVRLWNVADWSMLREIPGQQEYRVSAPEIAFSLDGSLLAISNSEGIIQIWKTDDWTLVRELSWPWQADDRVWDIAISPQGNMIAASFIDYRSVLVWNVSDGELETEILFGIEDKALGLAFDPDGVLLAISAMDGRIQYRRVSDWRIIRDFKNVGRSISGRSIYTLISSPNGEMLASGGRDTSIRLWDWNEIKKETRYANP